MLKLINRFKLLRDFYLRKAEASGLPLELVVEVTNKCNLSCIMCVRQKMTRPIGFMKMTIYKKIIDEVSSFLELIYLHGLGEPLFHPKIFEMIRYAKRKGLAVGLSTNATLLTKEKARKIIASGLDYLIIALDAATPKTFERVRGGENFERVITNVRGYLKLKKKAKTSPFTVIQFVKLKENEREVKEFLEIWKNSGADIVRIRPVIDLLREGKEKPGDRPCFYIWRQLNMISWDGKIVTPCCMDSNGDYSLGSIFGESIKQIWNNQRMIKLREAHLKGKWRKLPLCQNCSYPQPRFLGKIGSMLLSDMIVKKILPFFERFHFYE